MGHWWSDATVLDSALAYAEQAIPVVPLHRPAVSGSRWRTAVEHARVLLRAAWLRAAERASPPSSFS